MAYNREWDKGKQTEYGGWQPAPRGSGPMRDDDWFGGDNGNFKRRKYNDGGYDQSQGWEDSSYDNHQNYDQGGYYHDDRHHKGGGSMHNKKRLVPSEPSPHVIFLGLDPDFTESDMQAYLTSNNCSIESVTIIRDRSTGVSKGFGFAQFTTTEHARAFVDPLFPFIQIPPPASHGASARAAFYRGLEQGIPQPPGGRRVKIDYSQSAAPGERRGPKGPFQTNDGTRDIGNTQAPVLLFRGLDPLSGPQAIAQTMKTSAGLGKEGAKGMKRIILIKDKATTTSWGFAFVEFVDIQSASAVLASTMSPQLHPNGFRISDRPVAASFAHPYSFQPIPDYSLRDEACFLASNTLGGVEGVWVRYWDEASTAAILEFTVEEQAQPTNTAPIVKEKKEKKKKDTSQEAASEASALPVSDKPVTLSFKGGLSIGKAGQTAPSKKPVPLSQAFSMDDTAEGSGDATTNETTAAEDPKVTASKRVAPLIASKKTANNINKWNQVQDVLHRDAPQEVPVTQPVVTPAPIASVTSAQPAPAKATTPPELPETEFEFSDMNAMTCLLCARQFKSLEQLKRHNQESDLHKKNYKDVALREVARDKVRAARAKAEAQQPKYRDRASERRVMHNQPEVPRPATAEKPTTKRKHSDGPPPPEPAPAPPLNPGEDDNNIGNKLLKMMGWKEGQGLGTEGDGRVDPIQTAIYASGVGLGATKPKDITKFASDYTGYVNLAKDAARERYAS